MKYYITKYALTSGLLILTDEQVNVCSDSMISTEVENHKNYFHKPYWHTSREDAKAHFLYMIEKKLISLEKQTQELLCMHVAAMLDEN
jgi:hypothetical protein